MPNRSPCPCLALVLSLWSQSAEADFVAVGHPGANSFASLRGGASGTNQSPSPGKGRGTKGERSLHQQRVARQRQEVHEVLVLCQLVEELDRRIELAVRPLLRAELLAQLRHLLVAHLAVQ